MDFFRARHDESIINATTPIFWGIVQALLGVLLILGLLVESVAGWRYMIGHLSVCLSGMVRVCSVFWVIPKWLVAPCEPSNGDTILKLYGSIIGQQRQQL